MDQNICPKLLLEQYKNAVDKSLIVSKTNTKGIITYVNDLFCEVSKYNKNELIGKNHNIIRDPDMPSDVFEDLWETIQSKKIWKGMIKNRSKDNTNYYVDSLIIPILDDNNEIVEYIAFRNDITKLLESKKLLEKARLDELTLLQSRAALLENIDKNSRTNFSLALIDIKSFKDINDFYGHKIGDQLLQIVALKFKEYFQKYIEGAQLYRIPIDIFVIITQLDEVELEEHIKLFIQKLSSKPISVLDHHIYITAVSGITSNKSEDDVYKNADIALQYAKNHNETTQIYSFELDMHKEIENNLLWTQRLSDAIYSKRLKTFFQPIFNNKTGICEKYESLIRIIDENGNVVSPFYFLDISKQTKLYTYITHHVLQSAFKTFKDVDYQFTINLSVEDLENQKTIQYLFDTIKKCEKRDKIIIEITESEQINDFNKTTSIISELKELGCSIAIDDFGSGYSNFNYLLQLKADYIKIDGSLIKNINTDSSSYSIVKAIVSFAKEMNIKTVAEYVHNKEVYDVVCSMGIDYSQGYYLGLPSETLN